MSASDSIRSDQSNALVLLWQNRYRVGFVTGIGLAALALRWVGVLEQSPVLPTLGGVRTQLLLGLATVATYVVTVGLLDRWIRRAGRAGFGTIAAVTGADVLFGFTIVALVTPPAYYGRVLLLAYCSLQLTLLYFGRLPALWSLGVISLAYTALVAIARGGGAALPWREELWTLALFVLGSGVLVLLQGDLNRRLTRLVRMFERAEEGDFALAYDVSRDARPDSITLVGRAYNRMRTQLATIALTDPLSGCLNRRGFEQQLTREAARASRAGGKELALIAVDVDYFKLVNDTFGHLAGDMVIREIGDLLRENARAGDVVARMGGEEFMILAPGTNAAGAYHLATRVLEAFRRRAFSGVGGRIPITASLGVVADSVRDAHAFEALRSRADEALYAAKRGGRNRVVVWTQGMGVREPGAGAVVGD